MLKFVRFLVAGLLFGVVPATQLLAQTHPYPGSKLEPNVVCNGCPGNNTLGQPNDGLPTYPYSAPIVDHAGRYIDSSNVPQFMNIGIRTVRAQAIHVAKNTRGTAPPRIYIQLGSAIGAYTLDSFFATKLPGGMISVDTVFGAVRQSPPGRNPPEKFLKWDQFVYPEATTTWRCPFQDGQDRLGDFDFDDRGYIYAAYTVFGWGIVKDEGGTSGTQMTKVAQLIGGGDNGEPSKYPKTFDDTTGVSPETMMVFKSGSKYYAVITSKVRDTAIWDVTDPAAPKLVTKRPGEQYAMRKWDRDDASQRFAYTDYNNKLHVYDYADYISGGAPILEQTASAGKFIDVSFDENGNLFAVENKSNIWKFTKTGNHYSQQMFSPFPTMDDIKAMHVADGYIMFAGTERGSSIYFDVKLLKVESSNIRLVDIDNFFKKYYHLAPSGYAEPGDYASVQSDVQVLKWNGKTYIFYSVFGLGDVYEIQGGESINIKVKDNAFGTANPNSKSTTPGPYVGDTVTFSAPSSNSQVTYDVTWDFGNPEGGATENQGQNKSTNEISHQYTGYTTAGQITQAKTIRAVTVQDSAVASQYSLTLKVPAPRIGISGVATALSAAPTGLKLVAGQTFNDASDGSNEGHVAAWTIDGTLTKQAPNQSIAAGAVGTHTMSFKGQYGRHDGSFNGTNLYETPALAFSYTVVPFKATINSPTADATNVTFGGTGNVTADTSIVTATTWTVTWTFTPGGTSTSAPITQTTTATVGTIPAFVVPKAQVTTGSVVQLQVVIDAVGLSDPAKPYGTSTDSMTLSTPDPAIAITGCANANSPCKFTASSLSSASMSDWTFSWTLKKDGVTVKTGSGNPFEPPITAAGNYTVSLKVVKSIFDATVEKSQTVAESLCPSLPASTSIGINKIGCSSGCAAGTTVTLSASIQGYTQAACHSFAWTFGSGEGTGTGIETQHTYNTAGSYTVTLTITDGSGGSVTKSTTVTINGGQTDNSCTAPTNATVTYAGTLGCTSGINCRTTETITFTAKRGVNSLQNCDNVLWTFSDNTTSTARQPSKQWSTAGTYWAKVKITNSKSSTGVESQQMTVAVVNPPTGDCSTAPGVGNFAITFSGATSGCTNINGNKCQASEVINFNADNYYGYVPGPCDNYEWDYGDNSTKGTTRAATHSYTASGSFPVKLKVYNNSGSWTYSKTVQVEGSVATQPIPVITPSFPANGVKGRTITFTASSSVANTTGWTWSFGDGTANDTSQAGETKQSSSITHTFANKGTFTVKATGRNAADAATAPVGTGQGSIVIADAPAIPEFRYLLPVTVHAKGQFNSVWRTDVQIYNADPTISVSNPLRMTASFKGSEFNLEVTKSTTIYEDFLGRLLDHDDQGPVIITTKNTTAPPQIWTRTYNQAEGGGTFGQFIPAIRLDNAGSGGAVDSGTYFLSGLRHDDRYRTNIGFLNPNALPIQATITVYNEVRLKLGEYTETLQPFQLVQYALKSKETDTFKLPANAPFSVKITIPSTGGNWLIAYASFIDGISNDPVFLQAVRESDVASVDYKNQVVPGIGHTGAWRSDVTIFNPDPDAAQFDLQYYNGNGEKKGEALGIVLDSGKFLQYGDLLKQGVLGNVEDGFGLMKLIVKSTHEKYPMTFSRTYFDDVANGTYGQGISAFATARANVKPNKPALIPGVRNTSAYKTNIGLVNLAATAVTAKITLLDPITGANVTTIDYPLGPNQSIIGSFNGFGSIETGTLKVEANGDVWAFCSVIDNRTKDPEYVPATPLQ